LSYPLDEVYFEWLYGLISKNANKRPSQTYWSLASAMYRTPYHWFVPNDDNRAEDGRDLRYEFINKRKIKSVDHLWMDLECSVLEMLIALSRRAAFESYGTPDLWFWRFVDTLDLKKFTDDKFTRRSAVEIDRTLERLIQRTYDRDGNGGLFPLDRPRLDQREVELWYQMASYVLEEQ